MVFLKALDDVSAEERGTLALQCEVSDPQARVVWRKDGVEVGPSDKYDFLHTAGTRGLVVHDLSRDDTGLYTCSVGSEETRARVSVHGAWLRELQGAGQAQGRGRGRGRGHGAGSVPRGGAGPWDGGGSRNGSGRRERSLFREVGGGGQRAELFPGGGAGSRGWSRIQGAGAGPGAGLGPGAEPVSGGGVGGCLCRGL